MKTTAWTLTALFFLAATFAHSQEATPTPTIAASNPATFKATDVPWAQWFKKNVMVSNKTEYVHFFFNAQDCRGFFEGKDKENRIALCASQLVAQLYPATATSDVIKMDIVFVTQRDEYGEPKWDSLVRLAHLEFSKAAALKRAKSKAPFTKAETKKIFKVLQLFED